MKGYSRKANVKFLMKEYEKALETYEKGLTYAPDSSELQDGIRRCQAQIQRFMTGQASEEEVKERQAKAMADPDVRPHPHPTPLHCSTALHCALRQHRAVCLLCWSRHFECDRRSSNSVRRASFNCCVELWPVVQPSRPMVCCQCGSRKWRQLSCILNAVCSGLDHFGAITCGLPQQKVVTNMASRFMRLFGFICLLALRIQEGLLPQQSICVTPTLPCRFRTS